MAVVMTAA